MSGTITERILYQNPANVQNLRKILTDLNFDVLSVGADFPGATVETSTIVKLDLYPESDDDAMVDRFKDMVVRYNRIELPMALRSKLPVKDNWLQIAMPEYGREYTLSDFVIALRALGFKLQSKYYKLDKLTRDCYQLRCTKLNPRFMGTATFKVVAEVDTSIQPDVLKYRDYDFNMTDDDYLSAWSNYKTYMFCFTAENSKVVSSTQRSIAEPTVDVVITIDKNAHIVPNIGIELFSPSVHRVSMQVVRKTPPEILDDLGFDLYIPLGIPYQVTRTWDLVDRINELYDLGITKLDVLDSQIISTLHPIVFKSTCLAYTGEIIVDITGNLTE